MARQLTNEERLELARRCEEGESVDAVATAFWVSVRTVRRYVNWARIPEDIRDNLPKGVRPNHSYRYLMQRLPDDSPYVSMREKNGFVMQHRLRMAEYLQRPLETWETVHHIDGNGWNNDIDNLQLRVGHHGPHAVYQCMDCGSYRLKPVEISD